MDTPTDPFGAGRLGATTVYIFNMSEDVWPFIQAMSKPRERELEITENANLADRDLFTMAGEERVIFIFPRKVSEAFLSYYQELFSNRSLRVVVPDKHTGATCDDIIADERVMGELVSAANGSKRLILSAYTTSPQFLHLVEVLRAKGLQVYTPEAPEPEDAWTVNFYGSKSGIRQLAQQSSAAEPDFVMARGLICTSPADAAKIAAKMYIKEGGVVLKTNKGHSGAGILLFRPGDLPGAYNDVERAILAKFSEEKYWSMFPIIVEEFVSLSTTVGGGSPSVEFKIAKNGRVEYLYYGGMRISKDGVFHGMEINNDVVSDQVGARMVDTGFFVAERYAAAGYRGYFDVDFVASKNGQLYVTESNVRRTGGTHVYRTALDLFGKDFMYLVYTLSNNNYDLPAGFRPTFPQIMQVLSGILYDKKTKEGLIVASENLLSQGKFAYIIFGKTKRRAYEIEEQMEQLLKTGSVS